MSASHCREQANCLLRNYPGIYMKRDVYLTDFISELARQDMLEEFNTWLELARPELTNPYEALHVLVDSYPGGRFAAYKALRNSVKFWEMI